jgi:hypothetical protein
VKTHRSPARAEAPQPDFITAQMLAALMSCSLGDLHNQHSSGRGPVAALLVKVGGRVGVWRQDYETWRDSQRRLPVINDSAAGRICRPVMSSSGT